MKRNIFSIIALIGVSALVLGSCKKQPGTGGDGSINGYVFARHYNSTFTEFISEYPASDVYVYLIYGDNISYGQRIKTNYAGEFEFKYLYEGEYTLYVYSLDSTMASASGNIAITKKVSIQNRKDAVDAGTFEIFQ